MTKLARVLGLRDLTLLTMGAVIGSGIFLVPGEVLKQVGGRIAPALLVWLVGGILSLLGALTYGELSVVNPKTGGLYVHIRDCFGRLPAFLFGWTMFFAISSGTVATLAVAFSDTLGQLLPLSTLSSKLIALAMIALVTAVNVRGTRTGADVQNWTTAIKVGAIIIMSLILLVLGRGFVGANESVWPARVDGSLAKGFGLAMIAVLWAYEGWQYGTFSAGEIINPKRNFPRAFLLGTLALIAIYLLTNVAYLAALGPEGVAQSKSAAAASLTAVLNPAAAKLITVAIMISIFSATNSNVLTSPRIYYAMAEDGLFFRRLAEVHPRFGTPAFAIVAGSLWASALAVSGSFNELLAYVVFSGWLFYGLAAASIFVYRRRMPKAERAYSVPGYPFTPLLFILAAVVLVINTAVAKFEESPKRTAIALGVILIGVPAYFIWRSRSEVVLDAVQAPEEA
ncbi:MAG TPA: amino acid permease [Blastocatellia bacterium]|nr:amino acid permease [Blastocatellia bacterium]